MRPSLTTLTDYGAALTAAGGILSLIGLLKGNGRIIPLATACLAFGSVLVLTRQYYAASYERHTDIYLLVLALIAVVTLGLIILGAVEHFHNGKSEASDNEERDQECERPAICKCQEKHLVRVRALRTRHVGFALAAAFTSEVLLTGLLGKRPRGLRKGQ